MTPRDFAAILLWNLNLPVTKNNVAALIAAQAWEGGFMENRASYNPLNTTQPMTGSVAVTPVGVKAYDSWRTGMSATATTLRNGFYKALLASFQADNPPDMTLKAWADSPWGWDGKVLGPAANYQAYGDKEFPS